MKSRSFHRLAPVLALALAPGLAAGQSRAHEAALPFRVCELVGADAVSDLAGPAEDLLRLAEITGEAAPIARGLRRPSDELRGCGADLGDPILSFELVDVHLATPSLVGVANSAYPEDRNNGGLWSGRGLSTQLAGGVRVSAGPVEAGFIPALRWSQNEEFDRIVVNRPGFSADANPYYNDIDLPQRYGDAGFTEVAPGQSYARVSYAGVSAGVSTENVWLGPAVRNPILLSNTADGFAHAFIESTDPFDVWIGHLDLSLLYGFVEESDHFDSNERNDDGRISAWTATLRPRGVNELELGVGRTFRWDPDYAPEGLLAPLGIGTADDAGLGMLSFFGRFRLPRSDAEAWFEWARTDGYTSFVDDLITEPEYSQAFVAGFQKVSTSWLPLRFMAEVAHLQEKQTERVGRSVPIYYTHPAVRQGHTQRGQMLGAAIGPGGDAQYIQADWLLERGYAGFFVERLRRNDGSQIAVRTRFDSYLHDTQVTAGLRGGAFFHGFLIDADVSLSHRFMRDFIRDENNLRVTLEMMWWPGF